MAIDTKPNFSSNKFEQCSNDVMNLSGCTQIYGIFDMESGSTLTICANAGVGKVLTSDATGVATWQVGGGEKISRVITQASHGFAVKDVVGFSGTTYNKAIADGTYDGEVLGVVTVSADTNTFELTQAGYVEGLSSLVTNTTYFLSDVTAGLLTSTEPTTEGSISKAVLIANSTTTGWVLPYAGYVVTTGSSGGGGTWGTITGTLSDQTDLQDALDGKLFTTAFTYNLNSPATCAVGGVSPGYVLAGKSIDCIIQDAFAPYIAPSFSSFGNNISSPFQVGTALSGSKIFTWVTTPDANVCTNSIGICQVGGALLGSGLADDGSESLSIGTLTNTGATTFTWRVSGCSTQNATFTRDVSKYSIYPYFWGVETCGTRPVPSNDIITGGTQVVGSVGTSISITFNSSSEWTWFAMPSNCASRTKWFQGAAPNCGDINVAPTDKYPDEVCVNVSSPNGCWSGVEYKVYMSGSAWSDGSTPIQFRTY